MNPDYCSCNDFEEAIDYNDIRIIDLTTIGLTQWKSLAGISTICNVIAASGMDIEYSMKH